MTDKRPSRSDVPNTVPVEDMPKRILGNVLMDGPDGQCCYMHAGIDQRCPADADAHTFVEHGDEWVCVEMCAEHAREDVPEFQEWKQTVLRNSADSSTDPAGSVDGGSNE